ncbi:hypothetical protein Tco_0475397 [Tanacetum coccineum]
MRNEVLLEYEVVFTFLKRPYQEELEARILNLIDHQEDQVRQLKEDIRKTKDTFMCLADSLIATLKVKIEAQRAYSIKIEKITTFPTHTPTVTPKTLKPAMVHRVLMISKLEYEDEDEVEIKMMGTEMDKESLEHNLHENDMTPIICHNFSPTLNPPIKPKDSGSFRMKGKSRVKIYDLGLQDEWMDMMALWLLPHTRNTSPELTQRRSMIYGQWRWSITLSTLEYIDNEVWKLFEKKGRTKNNLADCHILKEAKDKKEGDYTEKKRQGKEGIISEASSWFDSSSLRL